MAAKKAKKSSAPAEKAAAESTALKAAEPKALKVPEPKALKVPEPTALTAVEPKAAKVETLKAVKVEEPKAAKVGEPKAAKVETPKAVKVEEPKAAKVEEPKAAKVETPKAVKVETPKAAKVEEPKAAKVEEPKTVKVEEPKAVKVEEPKAVKVEEPKAVKVEEPKAVKVEEPKAVKVEEPKAAKVEEPKAAKVEEPKTVKVEEPKAVKAEEPKAAKAEEPKAAKAAKAPKAAKSAKAPKTPKAAKPAKAPKTPKAAEPAGETTPAPKAVEPVIEETLAVNVDTPRRSVAFIGSECYPFVKTGGLGDVMYALPKALVAQNCDVKVILPRYKCIPWEYQEKMVYRGAFNMDLCADGRTYYVGIMEYVWDGVVYDFIDNEEFFGRGNPYINLIDDIPKYCYFSKAALAALNYMDWTPDIIHCHDWQASLVPVYLRTLFAGTKLTTAKTILTIHNLRFQGIYNIPTIRYWSGLPDYVFNKDALKTGYRDANMLKGGLTYVNAITTVSPTYAGEIQTGEYGESLDAHLRYHSGKLRGIINGIDYSIWDSSTDERLHANYSAADVLEKKRENKVKLQEELGLEQDGDKFVIGLISRLTDQKGLDLINAIMNQVVDGNTQVVVLGTGDHVYEDSFRYYENAHKGSVCSSIMYDETRAHRIYAGADALLVPSRFEPCGLTQLIAMHYGTVPIVRETGGLKDTVEPYNMFSDGGNGFTFDRYESGLLLDAINRAKTLYFEHRDSWDGMVRRDMAKDLSWENSAKQYKDLYLELTR